jgi:RNA polymerase sigma-70 factor, ECF subfamily
MSPAETRQSLIVQLKGQQNELAWRDFVCAYEGFLSQLARRAGVPESQLADVCQHILLAIAKSIEGWQDDQQPASFRRWLSTVARNVVIRFMVRERRHPEVIGGSDGFAVLQGISSQPNESELHEYRHELIVWAAEQVRAEFIESSWTAFWATTIEDRSVNEVAQSLGLSPGSIYMSRSRILARIRKKVSEVEES